MVHLPNMGRIDDVTAERWGIRRCEGVAPHGDAPPVAERVVDLCPIRRLVCERAQLAGSTERRGEQHKTFVVADIERGADRGASLAHPSIVEEEVRAGNAECLYLVEIDSEGLRIVGPDRLRADVRIGVVAVYLTAGVGPPGRPARLCPTLLKAPAACQICTRRVPRRSRME